MADRKTDVISDGSQLADDVEPMSDRKISDAAEPDYYTPEKELSMDECASCAVDNGADSQSVHCCNSLTSNNDSEIDHSASPLDVLVSPVEQDGMASAVVNDLRPSQFLTLAEIDGFISRHQALAQQIQEERSAFVRQIEDAEAEVHRMAERLYGIVDNKTNELLATASEVRKDSMAEFDHNRSEVESTINTMRTNQEFVQELVSKACPEELIQYAPAIHMMNRHFTEEQERLSQLVSSSNAIDNFDERMTAVNSFANLDVDEWARNIGGNLVGDVTTLETVKPVDGEGTVNYLSSVQPLNVLSGLGSVQGVAFLHDRLYVLRERCSTVDVYMFNRTDVADHIIVEQMNFPDCIVASESVHSIFVSDTQVSNQSHFSVVKLCVFLKLFATIQKYKCCDHSCFVTV